MNVTEHGYWRDRSLARCCVASSSRVRDRKLCTVDQKGRLRSKSERKLSPKLRVKGGRGAQGVDKHIESDEGQIGLPAID